MKKLIMISLCLHGLGLYGMDKSSYEIPMLLRSLSDDIRKAQADAQAAQSLPLSQVLSEDIRENLNSSVADNRFLQPSPQKIDSIENEMGSKLSLFVDQESDVWSDQPSGHASDAVSIIKIELSYREKLLNLYDATKSSIGDLAELEKEFEAIKTWLL